MKTLLRSLPMVLTAALAASAATAGIGFRDEMAMSDQAAKQIAKEYKLSDDPDLTRISRIIAWSNDIPVLTFQMAETDEINAFAIPGRVYFCRGFWKKLDDEERAGILAHEIAHIGERHAVRQVEKDMNRQLVLGALLTIFKARREAYDIVSLGDQLVGLKYSRQFEYDADNKGIALMTKAGYNPQGFVRGLEKLQEMTKGSGRMPAWISTHPVTKERIKRAREEAAKASFQPTPHGPRLPPDGGITSEAQRLLRQYDAALEDKKSSDDLHRDAFSATVWSTYAADTPSADAAAHTTLGDAWAASGFSDMRDEGRKGTADWARKDQPFTTALKEYDEAARLDPANDRAAAGEARVLVARGEQDKAERVLTDFLAAQPRGAAAWAAMGDLRLVQDRKADALAAYGKAQEYGATDPDVLYDVGFGFLRLDEKTKAADAFRAFLVHGVDDPRREVVQKKLDSLR